MYLPNLSWWNVSHSFHLLTALETTYCTYLLHIHCRQKRAYYYHTYLYLKRAAHGTGGRQNIYLPKKSFPSRTAPTYRTARCYISIRVLDLGDVHENGIPWFGQEVLPMNGVFAQTVPLLCRIDRYHEHSKRRYTATMEIMCMTVRTNTYNHPPARSGNYSNKSPKENLVVMFFCLVHVYFFVHSLS